MSRTVKRTSHKDIREGYPVKIYRKDIPEPNIKSIVKNGLPWQAYAIVIDTNDPGTWQLPHHTPQVKRAVQGKIGYEHTVDWMQLEKAVLLVSRYGDEGRRVTADPEVIIQAARHLASHYQKAGRMIPTTLCAII